MSLYAKDVPIKAIVEEIVSESGIKGWIFGSAQENITIELNNVSLQEGLQKILKNKNYAFVYNYDGKDKGVLRTIETKKWSKPRKRKRITKRSRRNR